MTAKIIVFTLHKCASTFIHRQAKIISRIGGIEHYSPNGEDSRVTEQQLLTEPDVWEKSNCCFAPVRFFVNVPHLERFNIILHLRDPRDVLVSMYYSYCHIHSGDIPADTGYRQAVAERGIDEFVLNKISPLSSTYPGDYGTGGILEEYIGNMQQRYQNYIDFLLPLPNVKLIKYEQMVTNYDLWLREFIAPFPFTKAKKQRIIDKLTARTDEFFPQRSSDLMVHKRHITPGDYRNKLQPETIELLNQSLAQILQKLDY